MPPASMLKGGKPGNPNGTPSCGWPAEGPLGMTPGTAEGNRRDVVGTRVPKAWLPGGAACMNPKDDGGEAKCGANMLPLVPGNGALAATVAFIPSRYELHWSPADDDIGLEVEPGGTSDGCGKGKPILAPT